MMKKMGKTNRKAKKGGELKIIQINTSSKKKWNNEKIYRLLKNKIGNDENMYL